MELYKVLELDIDKPITIDDIKKQYRRLAKRYHPDKYKGEDANEKFIKIQMAYKILMEKHINGSSNYQEIYWWKKLLDKYCWFGENLKCDIHWKKDLILEVKTSKMTTKIIYKRYKHKIKGIIISFGLEEVELAVDLNDTSIDYEQELVTFENMGNEIIENGRVVVGDLHLDVNLILI
jgi:curved DNA-binding protein CbpA